MKNGCRPIRRCRSSSRPPTGPTAITRTPLPVSRPPTSGRASHQPPRAARRASAARSDAASAPSPPGPFRQAPTSRSVRGWLDEAAAKPGCCRCTPRKAQCASLAQRESGLRGYEAAPARFARARECEGSWALRAVWVARVVVASRGSEPRAAGSCFRRHWGANASLRSRGRAPLARALRSPLRGLAPGARVLPGAPIYDVCENFSRSGFGSRQPRRGHRRPRLGRIAGLPISRVHLNLR